ncbi:hypothetical protein DP804_23135 [Salmonella enterica subsp. enterica]|nr:hypothetical protein [Salmonella enterica subsp. enterica serovar Virchow]
MSINPDSIHLKGFTIDPSSSTIGGTRYIFSTGRMYGLVFLEWSYSGVDGDGVTVQDVNNYLWNNGQVRNAGDNHTDNGLLSDQGWTVSNNNSDYPYYVNDYKVLVNPVDEDTDSAPGTSVWHLPIYLRPATETSGSVNVFFQCDEQSTLNDAFTNIDYSVWSYDITDFEYYCPKDTHVGSFQYSSTNENYDPAIYRIVNWDKTDNRVDVSPCVDDSTDLEYKSKNPFNLEYPYSASPGSTLTFVVLQTTNGVIALVDRSHADYYTYTEGSGWDSVESTYYYNELYGYTLISTFNTTDLNMPDYSNVNDSGVWVVRFTKGDIDYYDPESEFWLPYNIKDENFSAPAFDSFGQRIRFSFNIDDETTDHITLKSIAKE